MYLLIYEKITENSLHMSGILSYSYEENKNNHRRIQPFPLFMGKNWLIIKGNHKFIFRPTARQFEPQYPVHSEKVLHTCQNKTM